MTFGFFVNCCHRLILEIKITEVVEKNNSPKSICQNMLDKLIQKAKDFNLSLYNFLNYKLRYFSNIQFQKRHHNGVS